MAGSRARSILPLPEEVVSQIKSSTAIVSLSGVVLELLKNALDAKATKIEANVDFARGGCSVEDNGLGIAPLEFREGGGLGKLYCTSKYNSREAYLGRNGTFLASLAATSLLTITSHHHEHRSHNTVSFHHSKAIDRQLPAPPQHEIAFDKHGTRVTVRNLFGNLAVRVKQRAVIAEQRAEQDRLSDSLKRDVTGLLISRQGPMSLRLRDANNQITFVFKASDSPFITDGSKGSTELRSAEHHFMLNVLTQAGYTTVDEWSSWVPATASTLAVSINGAISLIPAPSKCVQFISLGIRPLSTDGRCNELYEEVNRIFALSSFGTNEEDAINKDEKVRRQNDNRFKRNGFTNRQLVARKGVDRYPMFHFRIILKDSQCSKGPEDHSIDNDTNIQAVLNVLNAMITQWLSVHHFRPRKPRGKRTRPDSTSVSTDAHDKNSTFRLSEQFSQSRIGRAASPATASSRKRTKLMMGPSASGNERITHRPFAEWSRIKSGNSDLPDIICASRKEDIESDVGAPSGTMAATPKQATLRNGSSRCPESDVEPILPRALNTASITTGSSTDKLSTSGVDKDDELVTWSDPSNRQTFLLNARTGCVIHSTSTRPRSDPSTRSQPLKEYNRPLRLQKKSTTPQEGNSIWLNGLLQNWDNPIFKPTERRIQQLSLSEGQCSSEHHKHASQFDYSRIDIEEALNERSISRLCKDSLRDAQVIAQLDKKFILAKFRNSSNLCIDPKSEADVLVLIDQHAADERIRVESLLADLCAPLPRERLNAGYCSTLGHQPQVAFAVLEKPIQFTISLQERQLFITYAIGFSTWGILFDILAPRTNNINPSNSHGQQQILSVTTLPPSICERCRADPQLLISFLRSTVWKYAEDRQSPDSFKNTLTQSVIEGDQTMSWVRRLSTCPQGLVDLINSRACRSAIMFNDELSLQQCRDLLADLSNCVFPFMCAHGRPSMVPVVDLSIIGPEDEPAPALGASTREADYHGNFIHAWKKWKR